MIMQVSRGNFIDMFHSYGRGNNFSYQGLIALYDYLEDVYEENYELDVIGLCCEFTEYDSVEDFNNDYNSEYETAKDVEESTTVIMVGDGSFIIQNF